jgi:hypothetical protein
MILLFCISLIRVEVVVNERKIGSIIHVEKGRISETASSMFMSLLLCAIAINRCFPPCE